MRRNTILFIGILTLLTYTLSLGNSFQAHDDTLLITENPTAHGISVQNIKQAFTTFDPELYIPLTLLTYQVEYSVFGLHPFVFHMVNLLLHIGSSLLVYLIILQLARNRKYAEPIALSTALLFALHPLNAEAVAWAAARKDVLSGFFFFLSLWLYIRACAQEGKGYWMSVFAFAMGLLAKVSIVILPLILLLADMLQKRPIRKATVVRLVPYVALSLLFGCIALLGKQLQITELTLADQILLWCKSTGFYLWKLLWPSGLTIIYNQDTLPTLSRAEFVLPLLLVLLLMTATVRTYRKYPEVSAGIGWFFICLVPSFATFWKNGFLFTASDRYAYIAMVGIAFLLCSLIIPHLPRWNTIGSAVIAVLMVLTARQSLTWKNTQTLYERSIALNARPTLQLNNLGTYYASIDDNDKAIALYRTALSYDQRIPQTLANIAKIRRKEGNYQKAALWFERSIRMIPEDRMLLEEDLTGYFFLGEYEDLRGNIEAAIGYYQAAAERGPQYALPHLNLGIVLQKYGRTEEAKDAFAAAVAIQPDLLDARYRLAAMQAETGDFSGAIQNLEAIEKIDPEYEDTQKHLENLRRIVQ